MHNCRFDEKWANCQFKRLKKFVQFEKSIKPCAIVNINERCEEKQRMLLCNLTQWSRGYSWGGWTEREAGKSGLCVLSFLIRCSSAKKHCLKTNNISQCWKSKMNKTFNVLQHTFILKWCIFVICINTRSKYRKILDHLFHQRLLFI